MMTYIYICMYVVKKHGAKLHLTPRSLRVSRDIHSVLYVYRSGGLDL